MFAFISYQPLNLVKIEVALILQMTMTTFVNGFFFGLAFFYIVYPSFSSKINNGQYGTYIHHLLRLQL